MQGNLQLMQLIVEDKLSHRQKSSILSRFFLLYRTKQTFVHLTPFRFAPFFRPAAILPDGAIHWEDVNKRFSYITRTGRVLGRRACRFSDTRRERRRSLETNSVAEKRIRARVADGPCASRPNFHCILETAGYYECEMFLPLFLPYLRLSYTSSSCFLHP